MHNIPSVYNTNFAPSELKLKYPSSPVRDFHGTNVYVFADTLLTLTGTAASSIEDLRVDNKTGSALDAQLIAEVGSNTEIQITLVQVGDLYTRLFKQNEEG